MGVPSSFDIDVTDLPSITVSSVGPIGPVTIAGIPNPFHIAIDNIPKIQLGIDKVQLGIDPLEVKPLSISMALKEIPNIRGHLPADFSVGLSVMGLELLCVRLCGEAQIITEPFHPNPCERCGATLTPVPVPGIGTVVPANPAASPTASAPKRGG
jgi:hypothetical protein